MNCTQDLNKPYMHCTVLPRLIYWCLYSFVFETPCGWGLDAEKYNSYLKRYAV